MVVQIEKKRIQKREQRAHTTFSFLVLTAFWTPAILALSLARSTAPFLHLIFSTCLLPLSFCCLFFLILILGFLRLGPYMRETQQQKQNWLNEYGQHIQAELARHALPDALIIGASTRGRGASYMVYLNWQDPRTGEGYSFRVNTRFVSRLRNAPEGTRHLVEFDASDPAFFTVPGAW